MGRWLLIGIVGASGVGCLGPAPNFEETAGAGGEATTQEGLSGAASGSAGATAAGSAGTAAGGDAGETGDDDTGMDDLAGATADDAADDTVVAGTAVAAGDTGLADDDASQADDDVSLADDDVSQTDDDALSVDDDATGDDTAAPCNDGETRGCWELADGSPLPGDPADITGTCTLGVSACVDGVWSACEGAIGPQAADACVTRGTDDNCNGTPDEGCDCAGSEVASCWELPDGTPITDDAADALAPCQLGQKTCDGSGKWGPCVGAVGPQAADSCDDPAADENCNGSPNDGCDCVVGATRECGTNVAPCTFGVQTCGADGTWGSECVGGVRPAAQDSCAVGNDDANCDGTPNGGCECVGNEEQACNECGRQVCNPATGRWGACQPAASSRCNSAGTGIEVCNGTGNWQVQACTNADATHCTVSCQEPGGTATCVFAAKDSDNDGYFSAQCSASPGDDCDDTTQLVSPGSTEICDGRDNDCDGYTDILDATIDLAGSPTRVRRQTAADVPNLQRIDITWAGSEFFLVADGNEDITYKSIYTGYARPDGTVALNSVEALQTNNSDLLYDHPRVTSIGTTIGLVVRKDGRSYGGGFVTLNSDGSLASSLAGLGGIRSGDITSDGTSFVIANHSRPTGIDPDYTFNVAVGSTAGVVTSAVTRDSLTGTVDYQSAAHAGSVTGIVYTDFGESTPSVQLMRYSSGTLLGPTELAQPAQIGDITALSTGNFAVAWATAAGFRLQVRATNGTTVVCDSQSVAFGNGTLDPFDSVAVAESNLGILVFAADNGGTTGEGAVFVFDTSCNQLTQEGKQVFNRTLTTYDRQLPHLPRIAVGGGNVAFAWTVQQSDDLGTFRSYVRVAPEAMCD